MNLLDRLLGHDAWTTRELLRCCESLTDEQLDQSHSLGPGSLRATFHHIIRNMEVWTDIMKGEPPRPDGEISVSDLIERLAQAARDLAEHARDVAARDAWDERWVDTLDDPPTEKSHGGAIAHVITHSMHHRAQIITMLRRLGFRDVPEGDVLSWENRDTTDLP